MTEENVEDGAAGELHSWVVGDEPYVSLYRDEPYVSLYMMGSEDYAKEEAADAP